MGPWSGVGCTRWALEGGAPLLGLEAVGSQGASLPTPRGWQPAEALAPCGVPGPHRRGRHSPQNCCHPRNSSLVWVSPPFPHGTPATHIPGPPARHCPGPSACGPGRVPTSRGLSGSGPSVVSRPFLASCSGSDWGVGPAVSCTQFHSVPFSQVSLLRAWEGSGDASFCSNTRPCGLNPKCERQRPRRPGGPPCPNSRGAGNSLGCLFEAIYIG